MIQPLMLYYTIYYIHFETSLISFNFKKNYCILILHVNHHGNHVQEKLPSTITLIRDNRQSFTN